MRKTYLAIISLLIILFTGAFFIKNQSRDIKPEVLPSQSPAAGNLEIFAQNLGGVRDLEFSPGGTLIASITSDGKVIAFKKSGEVIEVLTGLNKPHGIVFFNKQFFVAEETKVTRYNWDEQTLSASLDKILFDLPTAGNHFTRSLVFDKLGNLFISVGSTCNVCNEKDPRYGAVLISDSEGKNPRVFAKGLRNSVFLAQNPQSGEIWATEMGRDFLGDDLPPDEINILKTGKDYGWPNCYGNKIPDTSFNQNATCGNTEPPIYEIPAHSAPLGLTFDPRGDLLVAYHGSWNRSVPTGYKVVKLKVNGNQITGAEDFLTTGGRPVDLIFDQEGNLYISDDKSGAVYVLRKP